MTPSVNVACSKNNQTGRRCSWNALGLLYSSLNDDNVKNRAIANNKRGGGQKCAYLYIIDAVISAFISYGIG